jgi:hypothetical protein
MLEPAAILTHHHLHTQIHTHTHSQEREWESDEGGREGEEGKEGENFLSGLWSSRSCHLSVGRHRTDMRRRIHVCRRETQN